MLYKKNTLQEQISFRDIWERAMKILTLRDHSEKELKAKLFARFDNEELIHQTIEECKKMKFLDDKRFAESYIRSLVRKSKSVFMIKRFLEQKGVSPSLAADQLDRLVDTDIALDIAKKKIKSLLRFDAETQRKKLGMFLQSKGFGFDVIQKIFRELL